MFAAIRTAGASLPGCAATAAAEDLLRLPVGMRARRARASCWLVTLLHRRHRRVRGAAVQR
ncbi:MAG: hypothetical protein MZW92_22480 [Comamonadaceae bacterium]|nr:hypothetical protein [Comamonadaceae bacterium]